MSDRGFGYLQFQLLNGENFRLEFIIDEALKSIWSALSSSYPDGFEFEVENGSTENIVFLPEKNTFGLRVTTTTDNKIGNVLLTQSNADICTLQKNDLDWRLVINVISKGNSFLLKISF